MRKKIQSFLITLSLRTIIMILCSSFLVLVIIFSTIFYFTGTSQVSAIIQQNSTHLTSQASQNMNRKFSQIKDSVENSITSSYRFIEMSQNIELDMDPISAKNYLQLANTIQEFVHQNNTDVSTAILMLSNNSIVFTVSDHTGTFRCQQPDYQKLYEQYSSSQLNWIYKDKASSFILKPETIPEIGLIQLLGTESSQLHGLLYIGLSDRSLEKELSYYHVTNSNLFTLVRNGQFLLCGHELADSQTYDRVTEQDMALIYQESLKPKNNISFLDLSTNYALYAPLDIASLAIVAIIPKDEMFLDNAEFSSLVLTEAIVAILFCTVLFIIVTKLISAPTENLVKQVNSIESLQQLELVTATGGKDFLQITSAINHMYSRIQQLIHSLTQEMQNRKNAELQILYAQINPHFLYNTLDSINQLCELHETVAASKMLRELSEFYRIGVSKGDTWIPLQEELQHVTSYLSILQTRFEDFQYQITIPENLYLITVPKIILQPLAENSLYHGIRGINPGKTISITASVIDNILILKVIDDGAGIDDDTLQKIRIFLDSDFSDAQGTSHRIYGLKNVHQRIFLRCGHPYGLSIDSQLDIGTTVTLRIPISADIIS